MTSAFEQRLHGPDTPPAQFDTEWRDRIAEFVASLPEFTDDPTEDGIFSRPFTEHEIASCKQELLTHLKSASGIDDKAYKEIMSIANSALANLLSELLRTRAIPSVWLTTLLAAVPKAKGPYNDPENFRMIALEYCLLKLMTMLLDKRAPLCGCTGVPAPHAERLSPRL